MENSAAETMRTTWRVGVMDEAVTAVKRVTSLKKPGGCAVVTM
jgi:hypothetical protein